MTTREPRFEIVHSDAGWFARFVAVNGRKVWQTEVYTRKEKALRAVVLVVGHVAQVRNGGGQIDVDHNHDGTPFVIHDGFTACMGIREVDERTDRPLGDTL